MDTTDTQALKLAPALNSQHRRFPFHAASSPLQRELVILALFWCVSVIAAALSSLAIGISITNVGLLLTTSLMTLITVIIYIVIPSLGTHVIGSIVVCAVMLFVAQTLTVAIPLARPWLLVIFPILWAARTLHKRLGSLIALAAIAIMITGLLQGASPIIALLRLPNLLILLVMLAAIYVSIARLPATPVAEGGEEQTHAAAHNSAVASLPDVHQSSSLDNYALLSHDLRVPLTSIIGYVSLELDGDQINEQTRSHLDIVLRNAERLNSMLAPQTMYNHGISAAPEKPGQRIDIIPIIREVLISFGWRMQQRDIRLQTDLDDSLIAVADDNQIRLLLANLVSNAVKYNKPHGSIFVNASAASGSILLEISDSGVGIPQGELHQIRNMYYRASNVKEFDTQGNGIGLYTCEQIVRHLRGSMDFSSEQGKGTTVTIKFPSSPNTLA